MTSWMAGLQQFLQHHATLVLFVCISLGYVIGGIRFGKFRLGGVCGTLLVALVLGQANVVVAPGASQVAFALFIFSLGYLAGPQFVASFSRQDVRLVIFPAVSVVVVTLLVVGATVLLGLGPGTAAGLFAGGTSQSAALGTASEALNHIGLAPDALAAEQTDLASAYSMSYLCALVAIVAFSTQIAPALMRVDLATDARLVLARFRRSAEQTGASGANADVRPDLVGRTYRIGERAPATVTALQEKLDSGVRVSGILRRGEVVAADRGLVLQPSDLVHVIGSRTGLATVPPILGEEVGLPAALAGGSATVDIMIGRRVRTASKTALRRLLAGEDEVTLVEVYRAGRPLNDPQVGDLRVGDVITVFGPDTAVRQTAAELGRPIDRSIHADWAYLAAGIVVGMLIGLVDLQWGPFAMTIGTGGGVLLAGLLFGWFRLRRATLGAYNPAAAEVIKDLGLTIFIGVTGLTGAPRLASMLAEFGASLPIAALLVCLVPATISLLIARRGLHLPPTLALGAVVGQQCSTPALTLVQQRAGNNTPLITFVKVYALSNVILPLLAPMIIGITVALQ